MNRRNLVLLLLVALGVTSCKAIIRGIYEEFFLEETDPQTGQIVKAVQIRGGLQEGPSQENYPNGTPKLKGQYKDDHQVGAWKAWYPNGQVEWAGAYDDSGLRTGEWAYYHASGTLRAKGRYEHDFEVGPWSFYNESGELLRQGDYSESRLAGTWTYYHGGGRKKAQGLFFEGARVGPWTFWDPSGNETTNTYPMPQGCQLVAERWPNGELKRFGMMRNGRPDGRWTVRYQDGRPRFSCDFQNGVPTGSFCCWQPDGSQVAEGTIQGRSIVTGRAWQGGTEATMSRAPLPPSPGLEPDAAPAPFDASAPTAAVAVALAEASAPATEFWRPEPAVATPPPSVVESIEQEAARQIAPNLPWTEFQEKWIPRLVEAYETGVFRNPDGGGAAAPGDLYGTGGGAGPTERVPDPTEGRLDERERERKQELIVGQPPPFQELVLTDGRTVRLDQYKGRDKVLVVFLRGYAGSVCHYCVAQTLALRSRRRALEQQRVRTFVVYPGPEGNEGPFLEKLKELDPRAAPFDLCYDGGLQLSKQLQIDGGNLVFPTTVLIDEQGIVRHAYVGRDRADRPAVNDLMRVIEDLKRN